MSSISKSFDKRTDNEKAGMDEKLYWRSFDELAESPEYTEFLQREFPQGASELTDSISRRKFLTLMGASAALAGLVSCRRPLEKIVPYVKAPEEVIPGIPQYYATTMPFSAGAVGLVVESHEGRPTKIEGNELHPSSRGAANAFQQAEILNLYDPDRSKFVLNKGARVTWNDFVAFWGEQDVLYAQNGGEGLAVLTTAFSSPTLARLRRDFERKFPNATWAVYEPVSDENIYEGIRMATGQVLQPVYDYSAARVVLSIDADFLMLESENVAHSKDFAAARKVSSEHDEMNRLYVVESGFSNTGAMADHRLAVQSRQIGAFTAALILALRKNGVRIGVAADLSAYAEHDFDATWLNALAKDLAAARGKSLVVAGHRQPAVVHALVFAINAALGNLGRSVSYVAPADKALPSRKSLAQLAEKMRAGEVKTLVLVGGNPAFNAPADLHFTAALKKVENVIQMASHVDETAAFATWHLPQAHFLEAWGDARATDGTVSVIQPLILPLFGAHSEVELLNLLSTGVVKPGHDIVRETFQTTLKAANFEKKWRRVLHDGVVDGTALAKSAPRLRAAEIRKFLQPELLPKDKANKSNLEIVFQASPALYDGRYANNSWMQESPDPATKITWDNAAVMSVRTAKELGVDTQDMVQLSYHGRNLEIPVAVLPGHADYSISIHLGYGRTAAGRVGNGVGFNAYALRRTAQPDFDSGLKLAKIGKIYKLANTQNHGSMEGRPIVREATLEHYREHPEFATEMVEHPPLRNPWKEHKYDEGYQWGMTIDLNACTGCNACSIACQSENNIPVVGKEQVANGREMSWIRLDRYFVGEPEEPRMVFQPVNCQHCENAPCEQVCPVQATNHNKEGLNVMVYNRCIGTRYCSNNCPYKVRRFNFFNYTKDTPEIVKMAMNPDVTVRFRGVMEKCTFCLQRINFAKIQAKREERDIRDGELRTACQQTCPADAIVFGNKNDAESHVAQQKEQNRNYGLLAEFNTRPRTTYLAKLRNPNPELAKHENV